MRLLILLICCLPLSVLAEQLVQHQIEIDDHRLSLWQKPVASPKATILLLHGRTYSSLPDFDLQVEGENKSFMDGLNKFGYNVYALDGRGYGETPRDETGWLTPDRAVKDVLDTLRWIRRKTGDVPHLFGWSYGSMVTQLVAQREPGLVRSIILFGYPFDPDRHIVKQDYKYPSSPPAEKNTVKHAASDFITPGSISQAAINAYVNAALKADPIRVDFKNLHEWQEMDASKIITPTLLMQGQFDPIAPTHVQQAIFTRISTAKKWWIVLKGGDHAALLESPRNEMLIAIDAFIGTLQ